MAKQLYIDFDEYIRQGEPEAAESAEQWKIAIGLQAVDGIKPSRFLMETARRNIEGDITIDEVRELLSSYYSCAANRDKIEENEEEADKAAANIKRILSTNTLAFNTNGYISTHRRIFEGVFKHAGHLRKYDITKKEWVLRGDTVNYLNWEDLRRAIDYDIQQEKDFSYKGLSADDKIKHICRFTAGLWQIHAFCEGNTRTTAVFLIQYLRSIGYKVCNNMFADHSWYFRNALVRANYKNSALGIDYEYKYLERFFYNMLLDEHWELKNRYLVINPPAEYKEQPRLDASSFVYEDIRNVVGTQESVIGTQESVIGTQENSDGTQESTQEKILAEIRKSSSVTRVRLAEIIGISPDGIKKQLAKMKAAGLIRHVGPTKGGHWEIIEHAN